MFLKLHRDPSPSHQAERRAGKGTPTSGRHSPPKAGGGKDPQVRAPKPPSRAARWPNGGRPALGRDLGVQRHPDGCVVHAFRCAARSGADRRSAFPALRVVKERSDPPLLRCAQRADRRSAFPARRVVKERSDTPFRCAARSGADRRSAFPARRVVKERSDPPSRCAARSGADRRSAFPARRVVKERSDPSASLRCAQRCRPEVGVPCPACREGEERSVVAALRAACRPEVGVPCPACREGGAIRRCCATRSVPAPTGRTGQRSAFQAVPALFRSQLPAFRKNNGSEPPVRCPR